MKINLNIKENGLKVIFMEKEYILGEMDHSIKVVINMVENMDMVNISIATKQSMKDNGFKAYNMEKAYLLIPMEM